MESNYLERVANPPLASYNDPIIFGPIDVIETHAVKFIPNVQLPAGNPINAMFPLSSEALSTFGVDTVAHWRFDIQGGRATGAIGFAFSQGHYGPGWSAKGIYQLPNGNLGVNSLLVKSSWAQNFSTPAIIDWYMERVGETDLVIHSVVNGEIQQSTATIKFQNPEALTQIKPMIKFDVPEGAGGADGSMCILRVYKTVSINRSSALSYRNPKPLSDLGLSRNGKAGRGSDWSFQDPAYEGAVLHIDPDGSVAIRVANLLRPSIKLQEIDEHEGVVKFDPNGQCFSTRMMPLGDRARVEELIKNVWIKNPGEFWRLDHSHNSLNIGTQNFARISPDRTVDITVADYLD